MKEELKLTCRMSLVQQKTKVCEAVNIQYIYEVALICRILAGIFPLCVFERRLV